MRVYNEIQNEPGQEICRSLPDFAVASQDGPDFSHHIGQYEKETNPDRGLVLRG